jgi:phosphoglycerate dehydrogenase-like enzyme
MVATPLEPELAERIAACDPRVELLYDPSLLPPPRYPCDHHGEAGFRLDEDGEARWADLLGRAEVVFGIPREDPRCLAAAIRENAGIRWVQAMAAGAGEQVAATGLTEDELRRVVFTSASGVHAVPLAEFAMMGLLVFRRSVPRLVESARERVWRDHEPVAELRGATALIVGVGAIGREIARLCQAFGMHVVGVRRRPGDEDHVDEMYGPDELGRLVAEADAVIVTLPHTPGTARMIDREMVESMRPGAIFVNVGRGGVVDEEALAAALADRRIAGAALDVFETEPLPRESPLWSLPNVIVSPHSAALSVHENERIVELFCDNIGRYLDGRPLRSRIDVDHFY